MTCIEGSPDKGIGPALKGEEAYARKHDMTLSEQWAQLGVMDLKETRMRQGRDVLRRALRLYS